MEKEEGYCEDQDGLLGFDVHQDITAAVQAIEAIEGFDPYLPEERQVINEIRAKALDIIYKGISLIYSTYGEED